MASAPQTPLHLAVITTLPSVVRVLVMAGASPMALDRHGQTAAHLACEHRSPACLRALLDSASPGTVDLEARNYDGELLIPIPIPTPISGRWRGGLAESQGSLGL